MSLPEFLATEGVVAISQVDTRALTQHIRDKGSLRAVISTSDLDRTSLLNKVWASTPLSEQNVTQEVSCKRAFEYLDKNEAYDFILKPAASAQHKVVVYDCGVTASLLRNVQRAGCAVTVAPWNTPAQDILTVKPDGVIFSNGPGNPEQAQETIAAAAELLGKIPVLGVGFGMQIMALAAGAEIERLKFGHHGCNIPVKNLTTGSTEITTQHHNFGVVFASLGTALAQEGADAKAALDNALDNALGNALDNALGNALDNVSDNALDNEVPVVENERFGPIALTHINLNDQTPEGFAFRDIPAFGVQYHPDEAPGSDESHYVFSDFIKLMNAKN
jgi:carbamoyl-phosphate synthase small subunit